MIISFSTFAMICGASVFGLIIFTLKIMRDNNKYVSDLKFFLDQKTISFNQERAKVAVLKTRHENLTKVNEDLRVDFSKLQEKEIEFNKAIKRNQFLEHKHAEFEKLQTEITNIQETLNGNIKKQLANYMKEVDGLGKRLHRATYEFTAKTQSFEFIEAEETPNNELDII